MKYYRVTDTRALPDDVDKSPFRFDWYTNEQPLDAMCCDGRWLHLLELEGVECEGMISKQLSYIAKKCTVIATIDTVSLQLEFARWCLLRVIHLVKCPDRVKRYLETGDVVLQSEDETAAMNVWTEAESALVQVESSYRMKEKAIGSRLLRNRDHYEVVAARSVAKAVHMLVEDVCSPASVTPNIREIARIVADAIVEVAASFVADAMVKVSVFIVPGEIERNIPETQSVTMAVYNAEIAAREFEKKIQYDKFQEMVDAAFAAGK